MRIADLGGNVGRLMPAGVGPEHENHRLREPREPARLRLTGDRDKVLHPPPADADDKNAGQTSDLQDRE